MTLSPSSLLVTILIPPFKEEIVLRGVNSSFDPLPNIQQISQLRGKKTTLLVFCGQKEKKPSRRYSQ
jgi:hypothetical protein